MQTRLSNPPKAFSLLVAIYYSLLNFTFVYGQAPTITTLNPARNAISAARSSNVSLTFSQAMSAVTDSNAAIAIQGSQTGLRTLAGKGSFSGGGTNTLAFDPAIDFKAGEQVSVSVTANAKSTGGTALAKPQVFSFTAASDPATATFTKASQINLYTQTSYGDDPSSPCWADFDGDGDIDLAINVGFNPDEIALRFNDGKGNLVSKNTPSLYSGLYTNNVRAADFDGDGDVDLAATGSTGDFILLLNDGGGNFPTSTGVGYVNSFLNSYFNHGGSTGLVDFTTGDWDADGDIDIMALVAINDNEEDGYFQVVLTVINDGAGSFSSSASPYLFRTDSNSGTNVINGLHTGDWDNDGDLDVAIASNSIGITLLFNDGAGNYSGNTKLDLKGSQLQSGDFDKDGDLDIAVATSTGIAIRYNDGSGSFTGSELIASESPTRFFTGDFNGDGTLDIASVGQMKVTILLNNGSGVFTNHSSFPETIDGYLLAGVADFDGDKEVDIASISLDPRYSNDIGIVTVWLNNSTPSCTSTGSILREYWANVPGSNISSIPVNTPPTSTSQLTSLRTPANAADNYGQRIRGYLCAPTSGNYTFFLQGDDQAELYLSSDSTATHKQRIASASLAWTWNLTASQQSAPISLVAGKSYYLEVLHKEGSGGDQVRVGWRTPDMAADAQPLIIPGSVLSPFTHLTPAPTRLNARTTNQGYTIALDWEDNASEESGYVVERATTETGPYTKIATLGPHDESNDPIVSYSDLPPQTNTFYFYRVYATASSGASPYSNVASIITYPCFATGTILREYWANVPGSHISDIPLNSPPTATNQLTILRTAANVADHYGQRIRGYLCLELSGNYTFFIQGDDQAELWLSSDNDPAHKQRIAWASLAWGWTVSASQQSAPISLEAGKRYYLEVLHKEGSGGDQVRVGWRTPEMAADAQPVIIPGDVLSPFVVPASAREASPELPAAEVLADELRAFPNPFWEEATIAFSTAATEPARLEVYDVQGRLVGQLFEGLSQAGEVHQIRLESRGLSQGLYLVKLATARKVSHQKLLLKR